MTTSTGLLDQLIDPGTFQSWDTTPTREPDPAYRAALTRAEHRSGHDESVLTGRARINGTPVALVVSNFAFLGGSIGHTAADRITTAAHRATTERLPLLASPASGGTRMQEGTPAFVAMTRICAALHQHTTAGLPYLVYLRHPTFGGAMASWGSLGQITLAEPHAALGFLGPKVYSALTGHQFPDHVQTTEHLHQHGLIDTITPPHQLRATLTRILRILTSTPRTAPPPIPPIAKPRRPHPTAWECVQSTRAPGYPRLGDLFNVLCDQTYPLTAPGTGPADREPITVALATLTDGQPCVIIGQNHPRHTQQPTIDPAALRHARRGITLATQLQLPIVTVIDTTGGQLSPSAEQDGLAQQIAACTQQLATHPRPTATVLLGQGTGGAALALLSPHTVIAPDCAWLSPLPPEGASTILHDTTTRAANVAQQQHISAWQLYQDGIIDQLIGSNRGKPDGNTLTALAQATTTAIRRATTSAKPTAAAS